jgi:hypothetical protein
MQLTQDVAAMAFGRLLADDQARGYFRIDQTFAGAAPI